MLSNEYQISRGAAKSAMGRGAERGTEGVAGVVSQVARGGRGSRGYETGEWEQEYEPDEDEDEGPEIGTGN
jgi:hypothetical protein